MVIDRVDEVDGTVAIAAHPRGRGRGPGDASSVDPEAQPLPTAPGRSARLGPAGRAGVAGPPVLLRPRRLHYLQPFSWACAVVPDATRRSSGVGPAWCVTRGVWTVFLVMDPTPDFEIDGGEDVKRWPARSEATGACLPMSSIGSAAGQGSVGDGDLRAAQRWRLSGCCRDAAAERRYRGSFRSDVWARSRSVAASSTRIGTNSRRGCWSKR